MSKEDSYGGGGPPAPIFGAPNFYEECEKHIEKRLNDFFEYKARVLIAKSNYDPTKYK